MPSSAARTADPAEAPLQRQARALGDRTRYEIFRQVAESGEPLDVAELTSRLRLHHNAIRQHLAKLVEAELVVEERAAPAGRGRPKLVYRLHPGADSRWGVMGPYERLSLWLAEMVRTGATPVEVGRRAGRRARLAAGPVDDPVGVLVEQMARQGFDPVPHDRGSETEIVLRTCPFASTALADPDTVCELHLGIAMGVADRVDGLVIDELVPNDPRRANCRLRCHVEAPA